MSDDNFRITLDATCSYPPEMKHAVIHHIIKEKNLARAGTFVSLLLLIFIGKYAQWNGAYTWGHVIATAVWAYWFQDWAYKWRNYKAMLKTLLEN